MSQLIHTPEFPIHEEYGVKFTCVAIGAYDLATDRLTFHELYVLSAEYTPPGEDEAIPIPLTPEAKIKTCKRLWSSFRHRIMDRIRAAFDVDHPLHNLQTMADDPRWSDELNRIIARREISARDAVIEAKHNSLGELRR